MEGASGAEGGIPPTAGLETQPAIGTQEESRWTEARSKLTKDTLGHRRDERILETVIGLEVAGVNTIQSCEGHIRY